MDKEIISKGTQNNFIQNSNDYHINKSDALAIKDELEKNNIIFSLKKNLYTEIYFRGIQIKSSDFEYHNSNSSRDIACQNLLKLENLFDLSKKTKKTNI